MATATSPSQSVAGDVTLETLTHMTVEELENLYRQSGVPKSLRKLDGDPPGRMLAMTGLGKGMLAGGLRQFAGLRAFPWAGKTFEASTDKQGVGVNRVNALLAQPKLFRFHTQFEPSAVDGQPCVFLDYETSENPWPIRQLRDELREVADNLFFGPALWKTDDGARTLLYFAIDHTGRNS